MNRNPQSSLIDHVHFLTLLQPALQSLPKGVSIGTPKIPDQMYQYRTLQTEQNMSVI